MSKKLKKKLLEKPKTKRWKDSDFLSTGHTPLNLALSGRVTGGLPKGVYVNGIGDSDTGKSVLAMEILAQAAIDPVFKGYDLLYVNSEHAKLLEPETFCPPLADRLEVNEDIESPEAFYYFSIERVEKKPCVIVLDSMDALTAEAEEKSFKKRKAAHKSGKEGPGSYGMAKAKVNAGNLHKLVSAMQKNDSIVFVISQSKVFIAPPGSFAFGPKKVRSGGGSMKFCNRLEIWLSSPKQINKKYKDKNVQIGSVSRVKVEKNHITGKKRAVMLTVYNDYGVDDIGDCINFLIEWKHWKGTERTVKAKEFKFDGNKEKLIAKIEKKKSRLWKLRSLVGKVWNEIEDSVEMKRRPKYEAW